ncbi:hypothetical protein [Massilia putida]|nr:hypothetical protein [Massilia putida]
MRSRVAAARDRSAFVALRELDLRASELVGVRMRDVYPLTAEEK